MIEFHIRLEDGSERTRRAAPPVLLGRGPECGLRVRSWRLARAHARFARGPSGIMLEDLGSLAGTRVNGERVAQFGPLQPDDEIQAGPCLLRVRECGGPEPGPAVAAAPGLSAGVDDAGMGGEGSGEGGGDLNHGGGDGGGGGNGHGGLGNSSDGPGVHGIAAGERGDEAAALPGSERLALQRRLHAALLDALDLRRRDVASMSDSALRSEAEQRLGELIDADPGIAPQAERAGLLKAVVDEAVGLGPLEPLLADPGVSEIMVNRHDEIYVERAGRLLRHGAGFSSEQAVLGVIERIVAPLGRRIDESSPMVDARLRDGSRVNAVIAPVALKGASITIRKFPRHDMDLPGLVAAGSLGARMARFLALCVERRKNIVVSGGTGSGKTTLLNILSNCIPAGERVVTIEDAAELRLRHAHLVALEARPPNLEGRGQVGIRDLVRNALRMRPDRIVVGECRGAEAFDMLAAMNTGHEGSLTTLHANSPRDALARLETMVLMAGMDLPLAAVREHAVSSVDLLVQQVRLPDGRRLVSSVVEVAGMESGRVQLQELFRYDRARRAFVGCGMVPGFFEAWREAGVEIDAGLFAEAPDTAPADASGTSAADTFCTALTDAPCIASIPGSRRAHGRQPDTGRGGARP